MDKLIALLFAADEDLPSFAQVLISSIAVALVEAFVIFLIMIFALRGTPWNCLPWLC